MKKMKKKLMVVPMVAASLFATTACYSNIKFNQEDLDKAIVAANEYLENQNNYSSEFAYNYLIDNLIKGMDALNDSFVNYKISMKSASYDVFGNELENNTIVRRIYRDNSTNTIVSHTKNSDDEKYVEVKFIKEQNDTKYNIKSYDVNTKKYNEIEFKLDEADDNVVPSVSVYVTNVLEYYEMIYSAIADGRIRNVIMDKIDGNDVFTIMTDFGDGVCVPLQATFKDGLLVKMESTLVDDDSTLLGSAKEIYEFEYNISSFEIENKSSYTRAQ